MERNQNMNHQHDTIDGRSVQAQKLLKEFEAQSKDRDFLADIQKPRMDMSTEKLMALSAPDGIAVFENFEWQEPAVIKSELLPVKSFNDDMLPPVLRDFCADVSYRMQCPVDFIAAPLMVLLGSLIGTGCAIRPKQKDDWTVIPNLWGGVVGRPGMLKSPALGEVLNLLSDLERKAEDDHRVALSDHSLDKELADAKRSALMQKYKAACKGSGGSKDPEMDEEILKDNLRQLETVEAPFCKRYRTNDATIEKLAVMCQENSRGLLIYRDELMGQLASWDREDRATDRAFFLEAWNGNGSFKQDRVTRSGADTPRICLSLLGGIQPHKLAPYLYQALRGQDNDGLVQRLQVLVFPDTPEQWELADEVPDEQARRTVKGLVSFLANTDFSTLPGVSVADDGLPFLRFDTEAQRVFFEWLTTLNTQKLKEEDADPVLIEHLSKYRSLMPTIALILHLAAVGSSRPGPIPPVTLEATNMAIAWCDYLESHARRVYGLVTGRVDRATMELSRRIEKRELPGQFTARDITRKHWRYLDKDVVQDACDVLEDAHWIGATEISTGGRRKRVYQVNPRIFEPKKN